MRFSYYPIRWRVGCAVGAIMALWVGLAAWQAYQWYVLKQSGPVDAALMGELALLVLGTAIPLFTLVSIWLAYTLTRSLVLPIRYVRDCTLRLAKGDFAVPVERRQIDKRYGDEVQELVAGLQVMHQAFVHVVGKVRENAEHVATSAEEMALGNLELSSSTHQQADSLQQTAHAISELTVNVRDSAMSAEQANDLAREASIVASRGGEITQDLVSTMQGIEASARRIADITGLIDSIAFQTNMLALNASVEASRAGDKGKGFAVVANEVRHLAQRSAGAAREIKALVDESVNRVSMGAALVNSAGVTMMEIVESTRNVSSMMESITEATKQQNDGIGEVSAAMASIDSATQQNAIWANSSAHTSEELKLKAFDLVTTVSLFRL